MPAANFCTDPFLLQRIAARRGSAAPGQLTDPIPVCRLDLVAGRRSNRLTVSGALCDQTAVRLGVVLDRLGQLIRPTELRLDRVRTADLHGIEALFYSGVRRRRQGEAPVLVVALSRQIVELLLELQIDWSADRDVAQWRYRGLALVEHPDVCRLLFGQPELPR